MLQNTLSSPSGSPGVAGVAPASAASSAYKVDISRGERIGRVSSEWFSRPDDERFLSLPSLHDAVRSRAERATARTVQTRAIRVEASRDSAERLALAVLGRDEPVAPTHGSFGQMCSLVGAPASYLRQLPAPLASPRPFLLPALAAACARRLSDGRLAPALAEAIATTLRLAEHISESGRYVKVLQQKVADLGDADRAALFWTEDRFRQSHHPEKDPLARFWTAARHGPLRLNPRQDAAWLQAELKDAARSVPERAMLLVGLMNQMWDGQGTWDEHAQRVRAQVSDNAELLAMADRLMEPATPSPRIVKLEAEMKEQEANQAAQRAKDTESWKVFGEQIANHPESAFAPGQGITTAWNLCRATAQAKQTSRTYEWDRQFLEAQFGADIAARTREALRPVWREDRPTLWTERPPDARNTYLKRWEMGLAALAAEADDRAWTSTLLSDEARLACRYAPIHLSGLPNWLDDLARSHASDVQEVLGDELAAQLREPASVNDSGLLTAVSQSSAMLRSLFRPKLLAWLDDNGDAVGPGDTEVAANGRLDTVLTTLLRDADAAVENRIGEHARQRLGAGAAGPAEATWLAALMRLDPATGVETLEEAVHGVPPAKNGSAVSLFAALFGDRGSTRQALLSQSDITPDLLLRLVTLAYHHVSPDHDEYGENAYILDDRGHAQNARNILLDALLRSGGPDGWTAKLALAGQPWFAHMRDRVRHLARETAAEEADGQPATAATVIGFERYGETPPMTRDDMFQLMKDRLDDFDDLLLQDTSPREALAGIQEERVMRQVVAHQLKTAANGAYTVDQEAVTADGKETDVRLRSTASAQEGVIEIKVGEKSRSAAELRQALSDQLVQKYMAAEHCRAGVLLITVRSDRQWTHPDTGERLDLKGLIAMLNEHAQCIMADLGGRLRVAAHRLDLRPRLPPEREIKPPGKSKRTLRRRSADPSHGSAAGHPATADASRAS